MFRESLAPGRGMLFLFPAPSVEGFWMKNCNFPIDIVWMDPGRKVIYVNAHTPPCKEDPCPTYGPKTESLYVLEIPDGAAAKEKIAPGAVLKFENVPPAAEGVTRASQWRKLRANSMKTRRILKKQTKGSARRAPRVRYSERPVRKSLEPRRASAGAHVCRSLCRDRWVQARS